MLNGSMIIKRLDYDNNHMIKFDDGTMICYGTGASSSGEYTITFPEPFLDGNEYGFAALPMWNNSNYIDMTAYGFSNNSVTVNFTKSGSAFTQAQTFKYIAIGRWK